MRSKSAPEIQTLLLQLLEEGQLTDAMGRKADFRNTIVLLTANLGARFLAGQSAPLGFAASEETAFDRQAAQAVEEAKRWLRPELVGRLDEMIVFRPLGEQSLCAIAERLLDQLEQRAAHSGLTLHHTDRVGPALAARARSAYGARELRRPGGQGSGAGSGGPDRCRRCPGRGTMAGRLHRERGDHLAGGIPVPVG